MDRIDRYRIERRIGAGGMGEVYAAYDPKLERRVAVKLLHHQRDSGEALMREAKLVAKLSHPNVVAVYDVGEHEGAVFIVMELCDGPSLGAWVTESSRPWREILAMYFQAGLGLAAAHDAGLVHRDFKPNNVLVADRRPRVVDFGLAQPSAVEQVGATDLKQLLRGAPDLALASTLSLKSSAPFEATLTLPTDVGLQGTPAYMAPELFTGGPFDARADQFSYCVALYQALYGEHPFPGASLLEIAQAIVAGRVREPPARTRIPAWLRAVLLRGLAVDPTDRHPSIRSMLAAIAFTARIMRE